jgi:molecular chaperone GrpE
MSPDRPDAEPGAPGDPDDATAAEAEADMGARVAALEAEAADCKDRLLRALAEQENSRRRSQREREEAIRFAAAGLARDLLATADNLRRAIESVPDQTRADETTDRLLAGVVATERALLDALEKHGIRRVDALGQPFDPARHEAVFEVTDAASPPGTVAEVLQPGYLHHDRLLRPAMVGVAKGDDRPHSATSDESPERSPRRDQPV